jgi:hypothetical protein
MRGLLHRVRRVLHEAGNGRAVENARSEADRTARVFEEVDALAARLELGGVAADAA